MNFGIYIFIFYNIIINYLNRFKYIQNSMPQILIVEKEGYIKTKKRTTNTIDELYKTCGFRKNENFNKIKTVEKVLENETVTIELWGRKVGKNNIINTYKFPESFDNPVIYGNSCLIRTTNNNIIDLEETIWNKMDEKLVQQTEIVKPIPMEIIDNNNGDNSANNGNDADVDESDGNSTSDDDCDSELKEESYIYSSEEEDTS